MECHDSNVYNNIQVYIRSEYSHKDAAIFLWEWRGGGFVWLVIDFCLCERNSHSLHMVISLPFFLVFVLFVCYIREPGLN